MSKYDCIVAIDVGNSAVKVCVHAEASDQLTSHSFSIRQFGWQADLIGWVNDQVGCDQALWQIASVHRRVADDLEKSLSEAGRYTTARITIDDVPMTVHVDEPNRLGIDRVLSAFAAANLFEPPLIVVDVGSAITVDCVDADAAFCGGAILPGLRLQAKSLASGTDALPEIDWQNDPSSLQELGDGPAKNTHAAIRMGVLMGVAGAIERVSDHHKETFYNSRKETPIVLTGGDSTTVSPYLRHPHQVIDNLVCRGLLDLTKMNA